MADAESTPGPGSKRFGPSAVRILDAATTDDAFPLLRQRTDLTMLLTFLDRFDHLGWFPPLDDEKRKLLAAHDVIMHVVRDTLCFYEFCSKGARGERNPWLTIFFHVDSRRLVRICGIERSDFVAKDRRRTLDRIQHRVEVLDVVLRRRKEH